ncbi:MAG: SNF2-related protein [Janthinobacterium lividum]
MSADDLFVTCLRGEEDLRDYQRDILIPFLLANPKSGGYVGMGLGKTVSVLTLLDKIVDSGEIDPFGDDHVLIVAPLRVALTTWPDEFKLWRHICYLPHQVIRPDAADPRVKVAYRATREAEMVAIRADPLYAAVEQAVRNFIPKYSAATQAARKAETATLELIRQEMAQSPKLIHIINRERFEWIVDFWSTKKRWPYKVVIFDESTSFADHETGRWKAARKIMPHTRRIHLLSGTPCPEGVQQLFPQVFLLDGGKRLGVNVTTFRRNYMMPKPYTRGWVPQIGAAERCADKIADICIIMNEDDYLPMEKPILVDRPFQMSDELVARYKAFERDLILDLPDGTELEAETAGVLNQKLLQFSSGFVYEKDVTTGKNKVHWLHEDKIEDLKQILAEAAEMNSPVLVAYFYQPTLKRLRETFPKAVVLDRSGSQVKAWNAGKIPILLAHPQSAGHGLNMQLGPGHVLVFHEVPPSLEGYQQIIKRLARPGQKKIVRVYHQFAKGTREQDLVPKLKNKDDLQEWMKKLIMDFRAKMKARA